MAPIQLLAWEPPYATGAAQEMAKKAKKKKNCQKVWANITREQVLGPQLHSPAKVKGLTPSLDLNL